MEHPFNKVNSEISWYMRTRGEKDREVARQAVLDADPKLKERWEAAMKELEAAGGKIVEFSDPGEEAGRRAHVFMGKNKGTSLKYAYAAIFKNDSELYQAYNDKTAAVDKHPEESKESGGDAGGQASEEALDRAKELVRKYRGSGLMNDTKTALKRVFRDDPELYRKYESETTGGQ